MADILPEFVDRAHAAKLCGISVDTWDQWVRDGFVPEASIRRGQIVRWHWPTVRDSLVSSSRPGSEAKDPFLMGLNNVR